MKKTSIKSIQGLEILDSRGNPTIRAIVTLHDGSRGVAAVPSGASTGSHEAYELRDGDKKRFDGKGVLKALHSIHKILSKYLIGENALLQDRIDAIMCDLDGTKNKSKLGANAILAISLANAVAASISKKMPLYRYLQEIGQFSPRMSMPIPLMNVINGGVHAPSGLEIQECMIVPHAKKMSDRIRMGVETFMALKKILKTKSLSTLVGDEGGFAPHLKKNRDAFQLLVDAIVAAGYQPGTDISLATDIAANEFYDNSEYIIDGVRKTGNEMISWIEDLIKDFPLILIEDGLAEDDWLSWKDLTERLGNKVKLVGDDLFVTNSARLSKGISEKVANAILIKVNQIGTVSETFKTIHLARAHKYSTIISHRSGETSDTFIADLAVATSSEFIKTGSLSRSERVEKYNRLLEIALELKK